MKQWRCTVCGYIHTGPEPPEKCPVCGADRSKFVEVISEKTENPAMQTAIEEQAPAQTAVTKEALGTAKGKMLELVETQMLKHHIHPISAHIPNGVLPVSVLFVFGAVALNFQNLAMAAFYNLVVVLLAMPLVLYAGYNEWQRKYGGHRTTFFIIKIVCGLVVLATAAVAVLWGILDPMAALSGSKHRFLFLLLHLVMLAAAGIAGFIGGKLVFKD